MTVIVFIALLGLLFTSGYYGRKVELKRIEQIELQNKQQTKLVKRFLEAIDDGIIVYDRGKFVVYKADKEEDTDSLL